SHHPHQHTRSSFYYWDPPHRDLHSFPTRRSSDLSWTRATSGFCSGPASASGTSSSRESRRRISARRRRSRRSRTPDSHPTTSTRSEEHTSELQSLAYLVCRLLLEKKKNKQTILISTNNLVGQLLFGICASVHQSVVTIILLPSSTGNLPMITTTTTRLGYHMPDLL